MSWNIFHDHFKNSLVGNSENTGDEDSGHLRVTYHHNLFTRVDGRNPSIRFGTGHVYNNHYLDVPDYGVASRQNAQVRVENNYFDNVGQPIRADTSLSPVAGFVNAVNTNIFVNSGANSITTPAGTFVPPYTLPSRRGGQLSRPSSSRARAWVRSSSDRPRLKSDRPRPAELTRLRRRARAHRNLRGILIATAGS